MIRIALAAGTACTTMVFAPSAGADVLHRSEDILRQNVDQRVSWGLSRAGLPVVWLLAALCDILGCGLEDLVTVTATDMRRRKTASSPIAAAVNVVDLNKAARPRRARIISDDS